MTTDPTECPHTRQRWSDTANGFVCADCGRVDPA